MVRCVGLSGAMAKQVGSAAWKLGHRPKSPGRRSSTDGSRSAWATWYDDGPQALVGDVRDAAAARTDHVMVVERPAHDVRMLTRRQVDAFDRAELGEHLEERNTVCSSKPQPACGGAWADEIGPGELALVLGDQSAGRRAAVGDPVAAAFK